MLHPYRPVCEGAGSKVLEHGVRGVVARSPHHTTAGMCRCCAQVQSRHGSPVARPTDEGPEPKDLIRAHVALEDIPPGQPHRAFDIHRRDDLRMFNGPPYLGGVLLERPQHDLRGFGPEIVPRRSSQLVGSVLHETGHRMLAGGRHRRVGGALEQDVHVRSLREAAVLPRVIGALEVLHGGGDLHLPLVRAARAGPGGEPWKPVQRRIELEGGAVAPELPDPIEFPVG